MVEIDLKKNIVINRKKDSFFKEIGFSINERKNIILSNKKVLLFKVSILMKITGIKESVKRKIEIIKRKIKNE